MHCHILRRQLMYFHTETSAWRFYTKHMDVKKQLQQNLYSAWLPRHWGDVNCLFDKAFTNKSKALVLINTRQPIALSSRWQIQTVAGLFLSPSSVTQRGVALAWQNWETTFTQSTPRAASICNLLGGADITTLIFNVLLRRTTLRFNNYKPWSAISFQLRNSFRDYGIKLSARSRTTERITTGTCSCCSLCCDAIFLSADTSAVNPFYKPVWEGHRLLHQPSLETELYVSLYSLEIPRQCSLAFAHQAAASSLPLNRVLDSSRHICTCSGFTEGKSLKNCLTVSPAER